MIIDGKKVSERIRNELIQNVEDLKKQGVNACLVVIIVGNDPGSKTYVNNKRKACNEVGIISKVYELPEETEEAELLNLIDELNLEESVHGILVQLPLPKHINEKSVIERINTKKDVDCFHPYSVGEMFTGIGGFEPCTPAGIIELIKETGIKIEGKECVVLGRSNIVGKPMAMLLLRENGTVTIAHSKTQNLKEVCKRADILVVAIGKAKYINEDYVKPGAVVIDVGMNRDENNKRCGDVDFEKVKDICYAITPVPGGVGPMTITTLLKNTIYAAKLQRKIPTI